MWSREWQALDGAVREVLTQHQAELPVRLGGVAQALGLKIMASTLPAGISGEIRPNGIGNFVVRVNRHDNDRRQRFTVAHEIAHFLLHRGRIGAGIADDALYRSEQSDRVEAEANRLAADILMPLSALISEREAVRHLAQEAQIEHLASRFGVSEAAIRIRLGLS